MSVFAWISILGVGTAVAMPGIRDPVVYPPEIQAEDLIVAGEIRVALPDGQVGALLLEGIELDVHVHAGLAEVEVIQRFFNPYDVPLDAAYLYPLPPTAAVDDMKLICGDRVIHAEIQEREAARKAFEAARAEGRKAALLDQVRDNLFAQQIAGLCPGEAVEVSLHYFERIKSQAGVYSLSFPTTVGPRYSPPWVEDAAELETPYADTSRRFAVTVAIDEGIAVESLWSDTHEIEVVEEGNWGAEIALVAPDLPDRDFDLQWSLAGSRPRAAAVAHRPNADRPGYVAVTIEPQLLADLPPPPGRELLFLVDTSCSMKGTPHALSTRVVETALDGMRSVDRFNLVRFGDAASALYDTPQAASPRTRAEAKRWLDDFQGGGTQMLRGIRYALDLPRDPDRMRLVVLLTDGFIGDEIQIFDAVDSELGQARMFALGIGGSPNRFLLEGIAEIGRGTAQFQTPGTPVRETVDTFLRRISRPAMTDIRIDWGDLEVVDVYPARIPDLWSGQPLRVVARYGGASTRGQVDTMIRVIGRVEGHPYRLDLPLRVDSVERSHAGVAQVWARRRIRDLERNRNGASKSEVRAGIVEVALEHGIVSPYTSLIAVDPEPSGCGAAVATLDIAHLIPRGMDVTGTGADEVLGQRSRGGAATTRLLAGIIGTRGSTSHYSAGGTFATAGSASGSSGRGKKTVRPQEKIPRGIVTLEASVGQSEDGVLAVVRKYRGQLRYCYERRLMEQSDVAGRMVLHITLKGGKVTAVRITEDAVGDAPLAQCLETRVRRWRFPEDIDTEVSIPLDFDVAD